MHRTHLTAGDDGSTVHTNKPLSQPTTKTEPDRGLEKDKQTFFEIVKSFNAWYTPELMLIKKKERKKEK